jgi:hypothetical protein
MDTNTSCQTYFCFSTQTILNRLNEDAFPENRFFAGNFEMVNPFYLVYAIPSVEASCSPSSLHCLTASTPDTSSF